MPDERYVLVEGDHVWIGERVANEWGVRFGKRSSESRQRRNYMAKSSEAASAALAAAVTEKRTTYKLAPQGQVARDLVRKRLGLAVEEKDETEADGEARQVATVLVVTAAAASFADGDRLVAIVVGKRRVVTTTLDELAAVLAELRKGAKVTLETSRASVALALC